MKTIIIEASDAYDPQRRGIGVQMRTWLELAPFVDFPYVKFLIAHKKFPRSKPLRIEAFNVEQVSRTSETEEGYINFLYSLDADLLFFPFVDKKYIRQGRAKKVGIDYGMEDFYCRNYIAPRSADETLKGHAYAMQHLTGVITVSKTSKRDLAWFFPEYKDKIKVIYPGSVAVAINSDTKLPAELQNERYFFILGYELKKNIIRIAQAFNDFKQMSGSSAKLAIAGRPGYGAVEVDKYIASLASSKDILHLGYINDAEKQLLLEKSLAVVALPIYEGFGISALEGLRAGKIVVVSDNGSLAEIVGNAGFTADPFSISSIAKQFSHIDQLQDNPKAQYIQKRLDIFDQSTQARGLIEYLAGLLVALTS